MEKCLREISRAPCGQVTTDDYNGSWEYRAKSDVKWTVHSGAHTFGASPGRELQRAACAATDSLKHGNTEIL